MIGKPNMKAAIYTQYGGPDVVRIAEVPKPQPRSNEVLIRVQASTVNRTDSGFRSANYFISRFFSGLFKPKNQVLGCEFAGVVEAIGSDVKGYAVGDKIFGYDDERFGGHAEYKVIGADKAIGHIPDGMDFETAAAMLEGSHYALCDIQAAKVKKDDTVLVYGATGAIGSAAVQLLKQHGAFVVAVSNTKNVQLVQSLGADIVFDYQQEDFTQTAYRFDLVFDAVGKQSFGVCKPLLKPKGVYVSTELGKGSQNVWLALITPLFGGKKVLFPIPFMRNDDLEYIRDLAQRGLFRPVIDRSFALDEIVEAHRYVDTAQKTGNVVIRVANGDTTGTIPVQD